MKQVKEDVRKILELQIDQTERLTRVETDLKYHIKRTDLLEAKVEPVHKMWTIGKGMIYIIMTAITILGGYYGIQTAKADDTAGIHETLKSALSRIELESGCKMRITSGRRSKVQNKRIGGASGSYHLTGKALDIKPVKRGCISLKKLQRIACKDVSTVLYSNHLHIDIRPKKTHLRGFYRWERKKHGIKPGIYHRHSCRATSSK